MNNDLTGLEIYSKAKLRQLYQEKGLTDEACELLHLYFDAMCWLYGIITMRKAYEIFADQNPGLITPEAFLAFVEIVRHEDQYYEILNETDIFVDGQDCDLWDWQLVEQSLVIEEFEDYIRVSQAQHGKEFYIPERTEMLKYADQFYFEPTPQGERMFKYLCKGEKVKRARELFEELQLYASCNESNIQLVLNHMEHLGWRVKSKDDLQEFISLYMDWLNNTRIVENRGFTPAQVHAAEGNFTPSSISFGPNISKALESGSLDFEDMREQVGKMNFLSEGCRQGMLDQLSDIEERDALWRGPMGKVGRNDLCPCGSGKKYKNCCGKP